jgi:hypothetical protein
MDRVSHSSRLLLLTALSISAVSASNKVEPAKPVFKKVEQVQDRTEARRAQLEIIAATLELRDRYSDFEEFESAIAGLAEAFLPGKNVSARTYLEGLYFIAKRGSDTSNSEHSAAHPSDSAADH